MVSRVCSALIPAEDTLQEPQLCSAFSPLPPIDISTQTLTPVPAPAPPARPSPSWHQPLVPCHLQHPHRQEVGDICLCCGGSSCFLLPMALGGVQPCARLTHTGAALRHRSGSSCAVQHLPNSSPHSPSTATARETHCTFFKGNSPVLHKYLFHLLPACGPLAPGTWQVTGSRVRGTVHKGLHPQQTCSPHIS